MNDTIRKLQKNTEFRTELKKQKIGWRKFAAYGAFGLTDYDGTTSINMGKWNGVYDYQICKMKIA
jgi:hypothetical protein